MPNPRPPMNQSKRRWLQSAILAAGAEKIDILPWALPFTASDGSRLAAE
jgi:hypothetical protein